MERGNALIFREGVGPNGGSGSMDLISKHLEDKIGTITFRNERKRNCLSRVLLEQLMEALEDLKAQKTQVVVLRAPAGSKVWSAGLDIGEFPKSGRDPLAYDDPLEQVLRAIQRYPAPVIAMVEGSVWGGACDLAFTCDIVVGTGSASFAITPAKVGIPYNASGILHFVNIVGLHIAKEMFFTAAPITAERAEKYGILNRLVPPEELESVTYGMARQIVRNSPLAISVIKEQLRILGNSHPLSPETFERIQGLRRRVYDSEDFIEGKRAFLEKRAPVFRGE